MAEISKFIQALEGIGAASQFQFVAGCSSADMKAAAAYHPHHPWSTDPRYAYAVPLYFTAGTPPQSAQERRRFLQITKADESFLLRLPASAPENLLGRQGHRHFGDWHVQLIEDDRPFLLESFDEYDDAVAYVANVLRTVEDEAAEDVHEYASVGEVPC